MRFLALSYPNSGNLGDEVQTIAASALLPSISGQLPRDALSEYDGPPAAVLLNGWFSQNPENWPPSPALTPIFMGFHMIEAATESYEKHVAYFKRFAPIGCRDPHTESILRSWGVDAYTSYCATITIPRRNRAPANGKVAFVDLDTSWAPGAIARDGILLSHCAPIGAEHRVKMEFAQALLDFYRESVSLAVTRRLHCALPCAAMGIPVVFFGNPSDPRTAILSMLGIPIHDYKRYRRLRNWRSRRSWPIDWSPKVPDFSQEAAAFRDDVGKRLEALAGG